MECKEFFRRNKRTIFVGIAVTAITVSFFPVLVPGVKTPFKGYSLSCNTFVPQQPPRDSYAYVSAAPRHWYEELPGHISFANVEKMVRNGNCSYNGQPVRPLGAIACQLEPSQLNTNTREYLGFMCVLQLPPNFPLAAESLPPQAGQSS